MAVQLRDYQIDAVDKFHQARAEVRENRFLLTAAVGAGKTIISAFIIAEEVRQRGGRCLFVCHRDELIRQTVDKLALVDDSLDVGIIQGDRDEWEGKQVVIASVQTLSGKKRLPQIPRDYFSLIVVDETHRVTANSYRKVLEHFRCFDGDKPTTLLGITATAKRTDGVGLDSVYQRHVYDVGMLDLIERGALVPIRALAIETGVSLNGVKKRLGDFAENELASVLNTSNRNSLIAQAVRQYALDRKSLVFCVNVKHSEDVAATMRQHGIATEAVHGTMPREERRRILAAFQKGELQALTSVQILTEGYDEPSVNAIVWATRTMSAIKYTQGIGRGTRLSPETGKSDLLVIDLADTCNRHSLLSVSKLFGLGSAGEKAMAAGKGIIEAKKIDDVAKKEEQEAEERRKQQAEEQAKARGNGLAARKIDLFASPPKLTRAMEKSDFRWLVVSHDRYFVPMYNEQIHIWESQVQPNHWFAGVLNSDYSLKRNLGEGNFDDVFEAAATYLDIQCRWMLRKYKDKKREKPSAGQKMTLKRFGQEIPPSSLEAWEIISQGATSSHFKKLRRSA